MSGKREVPFINGDYYHVFQRTVDKKPVFSDREFLKYFLELLSYYRSKDAQLSYSRFKELQGELYRSMQEKCGRYPSHYVDVISYCVMPNHFHLLLRQKRHKGVSIYVSQVLNAFTRYYNCINSRVGPILLTPFKSVHVRTTEQLLHVSRYVHLNPYSSEVVHSMKELLLYQPSSLPLYAKKSVKEKIVARPQYLLGHFENNSEKYLKFVCNHAEYQRSLEYIKHHRIDEM